MSVLDALRAAMEGGVTQALGSAYARNATLDASLPGGRTRHIGRDAIAAELARWWPHRGEIAEWRSGEWAAGAALTATRDGVRTRHYLHASGDLIARHWVYSAGPAPGTAEAVPPAVLERIGSGALVVPGAFGGNSGAAVQRIATPAGGGFVAKRVRPRDGWLSRATADDGRSATLFLDGVMDRVPDEIDHGVIDVVAAGDGWWVVMRDLGSALLGDERRLSRAEARRILHAAAALHRAFAGERIPGLGGPAAHTAIASLATVERERERPDLPPKQLPAAWEAFAQAVDADVAEAVLALVADPAPLAAALERTTTTFIHGDLRDDNLGFAGDRVVLLDWDNAARTSPAVELGWFLAQDAWRIDATRDELVADFLAAEDDLVDEGALDLGLLCGILQAGWIMGHSAVVHPDPAERAWGRAELDWWVPRVRTALERTWAPA